MRIAVLVSGGVDSSVALVRLVQQGYHVTAFYLKIWLEDELAHLGDCPWETDLAYVRALCARHNVPLEVVPLQQQYWDAVVSYTVAQIKQGMTPNPDIMCNQQVKFGAFFDFIGTNFEFVATGHYAQTGREGDLAILRMAPDPIKDQTYFLSRLNQAQLQRAMFPIGHLAKTQVRALAHEYDVPAKDRKDSQGICFLGKLKFADFVRYHLGTKSGPLVEYETGNVAGQHEGFWFYTIGQRQGIGLSGGPWYIVAKNVAENVVYISRSYHAADKARDEVPVDDFHWIAGSPPAGDTFAIKLRHGPQRHHGRLIMQKQGGLIKLDGRDQGIAPGQFAVFYENDICRGSAVIQEKNAVVI